MDEILEYENLVYSVAMKFRTLAEVEDLKQVGYIGLAKAYKNYKEGGPCKFSTYAYTYILGEILSFIRGNKVLKINKEMQSLYQKIIQAKDILGQKLMREVTNVEVSCFLGVDENLVNEAILANQFVKSLDYTLNEEDDNKKVELYDTVSFEENGYSAEILDLKMAIQHLPREEQQLIYERYYNDLTQKEVSEKLNTSQVQVSRKEAKILKKLESKLAA